ncbi:MAG TPA: 50S ribosomal protein L4 [Candidatus Nanoarchaeia archaeon]|nr:50S ribosomal protein L4 [Candidatus Nanoarchaeia archaeon]
MAKVASYTKSGSKSQAEVALDAAVFGEKINEELVGLAYRSYLANGRSAAASTLTRGMVRGGGRKPWRQKGTGRARAGSSRIPHWTGGGVAFGPTGEQNYEIQLPTKMKRAAIRQALSLKAKANVVSVLEELSIEAGKTKNGAALLGKLEASGQVLVVVDKLNEATDRGTRNLAGVQVVEAKFLNVFIIMNADQIIITKPALGVINTWLGAKS